jgi:hypothetical protein
MGILVCSFISLTISSAHIVDDICNRFLHYEPLQAPPSPPNGGLYLYVTKKLDISVEPSF